MSNPAASDHPSYELFYHPTIPGRGEYIRLAFEATQTPYTDVANHSPTGYATVQAAISPTATTIPPANPPAFAPPCLRINNSLLISQTPNILLYLAPQLGLDPPDPAARWHANALVLTALDANNEAHDTHHPVAVGAYYEDQRPEARRKAADFRAARLPKYLGYFARVLQGNAAGRGRHLVGDALTVADLAVWQLLDGLLYAFPREMAARRGEAGMEALLGGFYEGLKGGVLREYLESGRRLEYGMGVFRRYPELDRE